jgi:hypothetical protein
MRNVFCKKETVEIHGCDHVQAAWLSKLSWKMQTVVNQGLRAPDTHFCKAIKIVCRWMRSITLNNADKKHTFMCKKDALPTAEDIENEINYCSVHFATHFLYALEIIAYKHPDEDIRKTAFRYYSGITTELWHFNVETVRELDIRLADVDREPKPDPCPVKEQDDDYLRSPGGARIFV